MARIHSLNWTAPIRYATLNEYYQLAVAVMPFVEGVRSEVHGSRSFGSNCPFSKHTVILA
jgi:hypothetical protein